MSASLREAWAIQLERMQVTGMTSVECSHSSLEMATGRFTYAYGEARRINRHKWGLRYIVAAISFEVSWTNPLWELTGASTESEFGATLDLLTAAVEQQPIWRLTRSAPWEEPSSSFWWLFGR